MATDDKTPVDIEAIETLDVSALIEAHEPGNDFENDIPTVVEVRPICPGCAWDQFRLDVTVMPPSSHEEAWRRGPLTNGRPLYPEGACRGNEIWFWCRAHSEHGFQGTLTIISVPGKGGMHVRFFPDKRVLVRPVAVERRGLPKGKP